MKPDKIKLSLIILLIIATVSWIASCTHDAKITDVPTVCFESEVLPIFTNSCAISGCHDGGGRESQMALNNYTDISRSVVPGNPNSSSLYKAIISTWGENKMPPDRPISLDNRTIIRLWIEQGAALTTCTASASSGKGVESGVK